MEKFIRYSPAAKGWYPTELFPKSAVPEDAVDVPMAIYDDLNGERCVGMDVIFDSETNLPIAVERPQ